MTGFAHISGIRMIARFALRYSTIVTANAGANHFVVIQWRYKVGPLCGRNTMACLAHICGTRMIARFAGGNDTIMTTDTGANNLGVIQWRNDVSPLRGRNTMACFA